MLAFSLVGSIAPGPVCVVAVSSAAQAGFFRALGFVLGATIGYTLMVILVGLGLLGSLQRQPAIMQALSWIGAAYLLYLAWRIGTSGAAVMDLNEQHKVPGFWAGAWALAGHLLGRRLSGHPALLWFNPLMGLLLAGSVGLILTH